MRPIRLFFSIPLLLCLAAGGAVASSTPVHGLVSVETDNPEARQAFVLGWQAYRQGSPRSLAIAARHFERATTLDPEFTQAHAALGGVYWDISLNGWSRSLDLYPTQIRELSRVNLAAARKRPSALSHRFAAESAAHYNRRATRALASAEKAIELDAQDPAGHLAMAAALLKAKKPAEAVRAMRTAMNLDSNYPAYYLDRLGQAEFALGQYGKAAATFEKAAERNPENDWTFVYLAAAYGHLGRDRAARDAVARANALRARSGWGSLTLQTVGDHRDVGGRRYFFNWLSDYKPLRDGLRNAGVESEPNWFDLIVSGSSGFEVKGAQTIDTRAAKALHERGVPFVDTWFFYPKGHIPGAHYLDVWSYELNDASLPAIAGKKQELVIYSSRSNEDGGNRWTPRAVARAVSWGYEKVYFFRDGLEAWQAEGYPVETGH